MSNSCSYSDDLWSCVMNDVINRNPIRYKYNIINILFFFFNKSINIIILFLVKTIGDM
jgi:hypothetical protein